MYSYPQYSKSCRHFIDQKFVESSNGETFDSFCPATDETLAQVASGTVADVDRAVNAAWTACQRGPWARMAPKERGGYLRAIGDRIMAERDRLARIESLDTGKPYSETFNGDIPRAAANFYMFAELVAHQVNPSFQGVDGSLHTTIREPLGVVGLITPWNLPLYLETWKIAPALAQGNSVVLKPAEFTPLSAAALAEIIQACDLPPGVFNVVHGFGAQSAGQALVEHPLVRAISFTGETHTGTAIMKAAAPTLKKLSFELGGKGASVIFADADINEAAIVSACAAFRNQGQICLAGSRLIVEEKVADQVKEILLREINKIKIGHPLDEQATMGSLVAKSHREKVMSFVEEAKKQGYDIACGGRIPQTHMENGAYFMPTLITGVAQDSRLIQEEIFGPVMTMQTFRSAEEAMAMVNGTDYGLSCSVWTRDQAKLQQAAAGIRTGLVWLNSWFVRDLHSAFGGMKRSGIGREGGQYGLDFFSEMKTICQPGFFGQPPVSCPIAIKRD